MPAWLSRFRLRLPRICWFFTNAGVRKHADQESANELRSELQSLKMKLTELTGKYEDILTRLDNRDIVIETLNIENLVLEKLEVKLDNVNVDDLSGALNIGVTCGVNRVKQNVLAKQKKSGNN